MAGQPVIAEPRYIGQIGKRKNGPWALLSGSLCVVTGIRPPQLAELLPLPGGMPELIASWLKTPLPRVVQLRALCAWLAQDLFHPLCERCKGEGGVLCDLDHAHQCPVCKGTGDNDQLLASIATMPVRARRLELALQGVPDQVLAVGVTSEPTLPLLLLRGDGWTLVQGGSEGCDAKQIAATFDGWLPAQRDQVGRQTPHLAGGSDAGI